jgi:hypothetical protein
MNPSPVFGGGGRVFADEGVRGPSLRPMTPPSPYDGDTSPEDGGGTTNEGASSRVIAQ